MPKIPMKFGACFLILLLGVGWDSAPGEDVSPAGRAADFTTFVQDFEENYAYLDRPEKPWLGWQQRYGSAAETAPSKEAFATVLAAALSELHDFHAEVRSPVTDRWLPAPTFADIWAQWKGDQAVVIAVRQGSDAQRAGILVGQRLTRVGSDSVGAAVNARLGALAAGANVEARDWALLSVLTGRADEARTFTVEDQAGVARTLTLPVERRFDRTPNALSDKIVPENIGLIRFNNSLGDQSTVAAFDQALNRLQHTSALILDLRDVPSGGDSSIALGIMGRFVHALLPYQHHRIPNYGQPDVERNWLELVAPRGPFIYDLPLAVLVDHWTGSMGEGMALGFDAMHRGMVMGTPMAHLAGAVSEFRLPNTGTIVAFATEQLYHVNGTPREKWLPPTLITAPATAQRDPILEAGLAAVRRAANSDNGNATPPR